MSDSEPNQINASFFTVFENHRKSLIQNWDKASYVYILSGQKFIKNAKIKTF